MVKRVRDSEEGKGASAEVREGVSAGADAAAAITALQVTAVVLSNAAPDVVEADKASPPPASATMAPLASPAKCSNCKCRPVAEVTNCSVSDSTLLFPRPGPVVRQCEFLLTPNSVSRAVTLHDRHDRVTSPARGPLSPQVPLALGLPPFSRSAARCRSAAFLAVAHTEPRNMAVQSAPPRHRAAAQLAARRRAAPRRAAASKAAVPRTVNQASL